MGLHLTRRAGEKIFIGDDITITVMDFPQVGKVKLSIDAPRDTVILREEVKLRLDSTNVPNQR